MFKVGDVVKCVNDSNGMAYLIKLGGTYVITDMSICGDFCMISGSESDYFSHRFVKEKSFKGNAK